MSSRVIIVIIYVFNVASTQYGWWILSYTFLHKFVIEFYCVNFAEYNVLLLISVIFRFWINLLYFKYLIWKIPPNSYFLFVPSSDFYVENVFLMPFWDFVMYFIYLIVFYIVWWLMSFSYRNFVDIQVLIYSNFFTGKR